MMKWTVLSDNRSNNSSLSTEHGLSILLETERHKILLDTGASDVFIQNAELLGVNLSDVDYRQAQVIVSPDAMSGMFFSKRGNLHSITTEWPEIDENRLILIDQTCEIAEGIHVIAHIPQNNPMPKGNQNLFVKPNEQNEVCFNSVMARKGRMKSNLYVQDVNGDYIHDDFRHELALYVDGLLFTGCAHSGLENILAACPWPVHTVVGGFHLLDGQESEEELVTLAQKLKANFPETLFYTSHCTGDHVYDVMKDVMGEQLQSFRCGTMNVLKSRSSERPAMANTKRFHRHFETPGLPLYWIIIAYIILGWFFPVIGLLALICMIGPVVTSKQCARVCPMQLTPYDSRGEAIGYLHPDCLKCGKCTLACPTKIMSLKAHS